MTIPHSIIRTKKPAWLYGIISRVPPFALFALMVQLPLFVLISTKLASLAASVLLILLSLAIQMVLTVRDFRNLNSLSAQRRQLMDAVFRYHTPGLDWRDLCDDYESVDYDQHMAALHYGLDPFSLYPSRLIVRLHEIEESLNSKPTLH